MSTARSPPSTQTQLETISGVSPLSVEHEALALRCVEDVDESYGDPDLERAADIIRQIIVFAQVKDSQVVGLPAAISTAYQAFAQLYHGRMNANPQQGQTWLSFEQGTALSSMIRSFDTILQQAGTFDNIWKTDRSKAKIRSIKLSIIQAKNSISESLKSFDAPESMWDDLKELFLDFEVPVPPAPAPSFTNIQGSDFQALNSTQMHYHAYAASTTTTTISPQPNAQTLPTNNPFTEYSSAVALARGAMFQDAEIKSMINVQRGQDNYANRISTAWKDHKLPEAPKFQRVSGENRSPGAIMFSGAKIGEIKGGGIYSGDVFENIYTD